MLPPEQPLNTNEQIQNLILESADFEDFLNELARFSAHQVAGDGDDALCGITLLRDRKAATIGWSSDSAREVDEIQYSLSQGPCLTAAEEEREVHVPDLLKENRWGPDYANAVASHGLRSVLSLPFNLQGEAKAALNLYSHKPGAFAAADLATASVFAPFAALAVQSAVHQQDVSNLEAALTRSRQVGTAIGILMARDLVSSDEAFERLRRASQDLNRKLRDIAAEVALTGDLPGRDGQDEPAAEPSDAAPELPGA